MAQTAVTRIARFGDTARPRTSAPLLYCGVVAGPLFLIVALVQVLAREGFDISRHALSLLSIGDWGWIQIANFVVTGVLVVVGARGMRGVLHDGKGSKWGPLLVGLFGLGLIGGGVFVADPAFGFPVGTPDGMPEELTWHGALHGAFAGLGFVSLIAACLVFARRFGTSGQHGWSLGSLLVGLFFLAAAIGSAVAPGKAAVNLALFAAVVAGFGWLSLVSARMRPELES